MNFYLQILTEQNQLECAVCEKKFDSQDKLEEHVKVHADDSCESCS